MLMDDYRGGGGGCGGGGYLVCTDPGEAAGLP